MCFRKKNREKLEKTFFFAKTVSEFWYNFQIRQSLKGSAHTHQHNHFTKCITFGFEIHGPFLSLLSHCVQFDIHESVSTGFVLVLVHHFRSYHHFAPLHVEPHPILGQNYYKRKLEIFHCTPELSCTPEVCSRRIFFYSHPSCTQP